MGRASDKAIDLDLERREIIHRRQQETHKRLRREILARKKGSYIPGEEHMRKSLAMLLKLSVPKISYTEIAARVGETKSTVKRWFYEDADFREQFEVYEANLKGAALDYLEIYVLEAVETIATLMRFGSEKYMLEAATQILDRYGIPKITRQEVESENIQSHQWKDRDALQQKIRELPPEQQQEFAEALEKFEELLADGELEEPAEKLELPPITNDDSDEEEVK